MKELVEFFYENVCIDCFPKADKFGRSRKLMKEYLEKIQGKKD